MVASQQVSTIWLESLTTSVLRHEEPTFAGCDLWFETPIGPFNLQMELGPGKKHVGVFLYWPGPKEGVHDCDVYYSVAVNACKGGAAKELWTGMEMRTPWQKLSNGGWGRANAVDWAAMRAAALEGSRLQANICVAHGDKPVDASEGLRLPPMLGGAFGVVRSDHLCDVKLRAGGDSSGSGGTAFAAHRIVLSAASPVFQSMFGSGMAEGRAAEVELKETSAAALQLLLDHIYGQEIEVPLAVAVQLYGLADGYQIRSDLKQRLLLWLSTVRLQPAPLCELLPAAAALCEAVCKSSWFAQAGAAAGELCGMQVLASWSQGLLAEVLQKAAPDAAFKLAAAWAQAQPPHEDAADVDGAARRSATWLSLLDAIGWDKATREQLCAIEAAPCADDVPGLHKRLFRAMDSLYEQQQKRLKEAPAAAAAAVQQQLQGAG